MAKSDEALYAFNRGVISDLAVARVELKRHALSAEEQTNFMPRTLGPMSLRPGWEHIGTSYANTQHIPFIFATDDTALLELSNGALRIWVDDALVTRESHSTTVTNPDLTGFTGWTDLDEAGAASVLIAGGGYAYFELLGTGTAAAIREQALTVAAGDVSKVHSLRIVVISGYATFRIGGTSGTADVLGETTLYAGTHSITFTPGATTVYLQMLNRSIRPTWVDYVGLDTAGTLSLPTPWTTARLDDVRFDQSGDVVYVACSGVKQKTIERRSNSSWSVVDYTPDDGPFRGTNISDITLTPSAYSGSVVTVTASRPFFSSLHKGALFSITHKGQRATAALAALNAATDPIRVTGVGEERALLREVSGTWVGTLTLQRSVGEVGLWSDVTTVTNGSVSYNDTFDNQIIYYRLIFTAYTSGTADVILSYPLGYTRGLCRINTYSSSTLVSVEVIDAFSAITASDDWAEGAWSDYRGYPSAVGLAGGRVWWAGKDKQWASISDAYSSFDDEEEGDSGPISRSIGAGPIDKVRWLALAEHLILGGQGAEYAIKSSALDEPITPTNFNLKAYTKRGSGAVAGIVVDSTVLFVDRSGEKVFELESDGGGRYAVREATAMAPEIASGGVLRMAVQRLPDTRVHAVLNDGTAAVLVYDRLEEVKCWIKIETTGLIKDVVVLPSTTGKDQVYYVVQRTVGGSPAYYLEKWADESECVGGNLNKQADSFVSYTGAATASITGLSHLEGLEVVCWADGADQGTFTVASGAIALPAAVTNAVVGLTYRARFQSTALGYTVNGVSSLTNKRRSRVDHVAFMLKNTHAQGLKYGTDFDNLDDLPLYEEGAEVATGTIHANYDGDAVEVNGTLSNKTQLCLEANAPRPCTIQAAVISLSET